MGPQGKSRCTGHHAPPPPAPLAACPPLRPSERPQGQGGGGRPRPNGAAGPSAPARRAHGRRSAARPGVPRGRGTRGEGGGGVTHRGPRGRCLRAGAAASSSRPLTKWRRQEVPPRRPPRPAPRSALCGAARQRRNPARTAAIQQRPYVKGVAGYGARPTSAFPSYAKDAA